jgi:hypothetical protein
MRLTLARLLWAVVLMVIPLHGQEPVCDLFRDSKAADGRQLILTGELIISKDLATIGADDCDNPYISMHVLWPTALRLRPSVKVPAAEIRRFQDAAIEADRLRREGKTVWASGSFSGRGIFHVSS